MSNVRIKKSVLQSIIKKSLSEGDIKHSDVERRLTVGPDDSRLPTSLPLSPSDRMSTQLEVERPPVDDPDYVPANPKELGLAVQALSELVNVDHVDKAYIAFKRVIERLEEEDSEDEEVQIESLRRKNAILGALMSEAAEDEDEDLPDEDDPEYAEIEREEGGSPELLLFRHERTLQALGISKRDFGAMIDLVDDGSITYSELGSFLEALGAFKADKGMQYKVELAIQRGRSNPALLAGFIQKFADENKPAPAVEKPVKPPFEYQTSAPVYGYKAASGLRQSFIRDILGVRSLNAFVYPKWIHNYINSSIREAFEAAFELPENQGFLRELFDEEGLDEYKEAIKSPKVLFRSELFKNFEGAVTYEALANLADLSFKPFMGKPGRQIAKAFMTEFGDENVKLQSHEETQLNDMARRGDLKDFVDEVLEVAEQGGYRGILTAAAAMTAEDADREEYGKYMQPAFSTMKKAATVAKPPELHVADYAEDSFAEKIKAADRAARKAARK